MDSEEHAQEHEHEHSDSHFVAAGFMAGAHGASHHGHNSHHGGVGSNPSWAVHLNRDDIAPSPSLPLREAMKSFELG